MQFQRLHFTNARGEKLSARLDLPSDRKPAAFAVFAHCFTCTKNLNAVVNICRALTREGIAVLRFDFTGLGESEGEFGRTTFASNVSDLISAAEFLKSDFEPPKLLIGHSLGGAAVLHAAAKVPSCSAVATIGAPADLIHLAHLFEGPKAALLPEGEGEITLGGKILRIKRDFMEDLEQATMEKAIRDLGRALLILHSPVDKIVDIENAAQIFQAARHPKSFVSLDHADHLMSNREDSRYVGQIVAAWAAKYIGIYPKDSPQRDLNDNRLVVRTGRRGYQTEIIANGHRLIADEPIALGGADTGPTPYDYLVAALGACTSMTLRMYADRKGWPLESIVVRLRHHKIHAEECRDCETKGGEIDYIEREIELAGTLDQEQRTRLLSIADRCPVHRTLHSEIKIKSTLKE